MPVTHPYRQGYNVLPGLTHIAHHELFQISEEIRQDRIREKQNALATQTCFVECDCPTSLKADVHCFLTTHYPLPLSPANSLETLLPQLAEDVVLHRQTDERDWMAFGGVFLPSGWRPEDKIGRSFREIHAPIPGMNLAHSEQLVRTIIESGPFERFVWSPLFEQRINGHPSRPRKRFEPTAPCLYLKIERQVTVGFPRHDAVLFLLGQNLIPEPEIDKSALIQALEGMSAAQRDYKGIADDFDPLLHWLRCTISE